MSADVPERLTRNRLVEEASPYLQQHADNPVNWQPWDETALEAAEATDRPIFLSIGYSSCHWCHVMAEESFESESVAEVLNEQFVSIKLDREERPDVDSVYMKTCQLVRGNGGWPLTVFLTPDGRPFYVGTYVPPEPRQGMPGFEQLCRDVATAWNDPEEREEIEERADQWTAAVRDDLEGTPEPLEEGEALEEQFLETAASAALRTADREYGGFGQSGPKFPSPGLIHVILRAADRSDREQYREVVRETLDGMANGGMYDQLGGGFHRYATNRSWTVPHFEKMLYDQAGLAEVYLAGYQALGDERYATVAEETFTFVERELTHPEGGFYSTLDAESEDPETGEREEGAFWVWTPGDVADVFEDETNRTLFVDRYGVSEAGNFERGQTVLTLAASIEELAAEHDLGEAAVESRLAGLRQRALDTREERPRPLRDEKVLAGWNGLMISAFAEGALVLDPSLADSATAALEFCRDRLWGPEERVIYRRWKDGERKVEGYLEDYAALGRGALDTYQATGEVEHLAFAAELARVLVEEFWDADERTLYFTPTSGESLVARPQETDDSSTPSSTGIAARLLLSLDRFLPDEGFGEVAEAVLDTHGRSLERGGLSKSTLLLAADQRATGALELTVAAERLPEAWRERLAREYLPERLLSVRPPNDEGLAPWLEGLGLAEAPPIWTGRVARDGQPTCYTCRSFTCSPPVHDVEEALSWAEDLAP
jgi:uncharacterized protein YyaL (SSP411 family)